MKNLREIIQISILLMIAGAIVGYMIFKEALMLQALWKYLQ